MQHAAAILKGVDLAWWPTLLRSLCDTDEEFSGPSDPFTTSLHEFAVLMAGEHADSFEELTLP